MEFPAALNGWTLYAHPCFSDAYHQLIARVEALAIKHPQTYQQKKETKLLAHLLKTISTITQDPRSPDYRPGDAIGDNYTDWSRAKFGAQRYRLFFRYSYEQKIIVLAWVNDEGTLRTYGKKTDAYRVFAKMLAKKHPPHDWTELLKASQ